MEGLIPLLIVLMFAITIGSFLKSMEEQARKDHEDSIKELRKELGHKEDCPPHKWTYHPVSSKLTCTRCNYVAGS